MAKNELLRMFPLIVAAFILGSANSINATENTKMIEIPGPALKALSLVQRDLEGGKSFKGLEWIFFLDESNRAYYDISVLPWDEKNRTTGAGGFHYQVARKSNKILLRKAER